MKIFYKHMKSFIFIYFFMLFRVLIIPKVFSNHAAKQKTLLILMEEDAMKKISPIKLF